MVVIEVTAFYLTQRLLPYLLFSKWALNNLMNWFRTIQRIYAKKWSWNNIFPYPSIQSRFRSGSGTTLYAPILGSSRVYKTILTSPLASLVRTEAIPLACHQQLLWTQNVVESLKIQILEWFFSDPTSTALKYTSSTTNSPHKKCDSSPHPH